MTYREQALKNLTKLHTRLATGSHPNPEKGWARLQEFYATLEPSQAERFAIEERVQAACEQLAR